MSDLTDGCAVCGITYPVHGKRTTGTVGLHGWRAPSAVAIISRMARENGLALTGADIIPSSLRDLGGAS